LMKNILNLLNLTEGKYPKENIQDSEHGENLKSKKLPRSLRVTWKAEQLCGLSYNNG
jgi:hypothetical protein